MKSLIIVQLVVVLTTAAAFPVVGLPDEEQVLEDIRGDLSKKKDWGEIKLYGKWQMDWDKAPKWAPADAAKHPFEARTKKDADGVWTSYKGLAIYHKAGSDSWVFNRLFIFPGSVETHGVKKLGAAELTEIVKSGFTTAVRSRMFGTFRADRVSHVYSIAVPEDPELKQVTASKMEFFVTVVFDEIKSHGRETGFTKKTGTFRVVSEKREGQWVLRHARRKGELKELGFRPAPKNALKGAKTLATADLAQLSGDAPGELAKVEAPDSARLAAAVVEYYSASKRNFGKLFGGQAAREVTEIESVVVPPLDADADIDWDSQFSARAQITYKKKVLANYATKAKKLTRFQRVYSIVFHKSGDGWAVKHGRQNGPEKKVADLNSDGAAVAQIPTVEQQFASGGLAAPAPTPATAQGSGGAAPQGGGTGVEVTPSAGTAAAPTAEQVKTALSKQLGVSQKNFDAILGRDMAKKVTSFDAMEPQMRTMQRFDPTTVQVDVRVVYRWKRFDNVLLASERIYRLKLRAKEGRHVIVAAEGRGRPREVKKFRKPRPEVAAIPTFADKFGRLVKKPRRGPKVPKLPGGGKRPKLPFRE